MSFNRMSKQEFNQVDKICMGLHGTKSTELVITFSSSSRILPLYCPRIVRKGFQIKWACFGQNCFYNKRREKKVGAKAEQ